MKIRKCNICDGTAVKWLWLDKVPPLQNRFFPSRESALEFPSTDVQYFLCENCGAVEILKGCHVEFDDNYNNADTASAVMQAHLRHLAARFTRHAPDKACRVVEIGCGRGEFLAALKEEGYQNLTGYDPAAPRGIEHIRREHWNGEGGQNIECMILRHTLEEVPEVRMFFRRLACSLASAGIMYLEITNASELRDADGYFSLYPECRQLFSLDAIVHLANANQLHVVHVESFDDGKRLGIWLRRMESAAESGRAAQALSSIRRKALSMPRPIVVWGSGGRGSNILSFLRLDARIVEYVVDIDPAKHGLHMPPYGQKIVSPNDLHEIKPKTIIVANDKYHSEITVLAPPSAQVVTIESLRNRSGK